MVTLAEAQQSLESQRQALEQAKREQEQRQKEISTQQALRQGGISLQQQRKQSLSELQNRGQEISSYQQQLSDYQKNVLNPAQAQQQDYYAQQTAIENVNRAASQGKLWAYAAYGSGYEKQYAQQLIDQQNQYSSQPTSFQAPILESGTGYQSVPYSVADFQSVPYSKATVLDIPYQQTFQQTIPSQQIYGSSGQGQSIIKALDTGINKITGIFKGKNPFKPKETTPYYYTPSQNYVNQGTIDYAPYNLNKPLEAAQRFYNEQKANELKKVTNPTAYSSYVEYTDILGRKIPVGVGYAPYSVPISETQYQNPINVPNIFYQPAKSLFTTGYTLFTGKPPSQSLGRAAGEFGGTALTFGFFSPALSTGTAALLEQDTGAYEYIYDYKKGKWLRKNKITGAIEDVKITPQELKYNIKEDLMNTQDSLEQNKYLAEIYKKYYKNTPKGKEEFKKILEELYALGVYKGIPISALEQTQQEAPLLYELTAELPYMRGTGAVTGSIANTQNLGIQNVENPFISNRFEQLGQATIPRLKSQESELNKLWNVNKARDLSTQTQKTNQRNLSALGVLNLFVQRSKQNQSNLQRNNQKTQQTQISLLQPRTQPSP